MAANSEVAFGGCLYGGPKIACCGSMLLSVCLFSVVDSESE